KANAARSENYAILAYETRCESITRKTNCSPGGIIRCARLKKIAACASTQFWRATSWRKNALLRGLIAKCAKAKILPIMRQYGRNLPEHRRAACAPSAR